MWAHHKATGEQVIDPEDRTLPFYSPLCLTFTVALKAGLLGRGQFLHTITSNRGHPQNPRGRHLWNDPTDPPSSHRSSVSLLLFKEAVLLAKI